MNIKPIYYFQNDPKWEHLPYTVDGDKDETIGTSGCGPTCMAMILGSWIDKTITPVQTCLAAISMDDRTANQGTEWEFFRHMADKYNLGFRQTAYTDDAVEALKLGALVVCSMGKGYFTQGGHYILAYDYDGKNILVNDPVSKIRTQADVALFKRESKQYFIFTRREEKSMEKLSWKQILEKVSDKPENWEKAISAAVNAAKSDGNLGDLEIFEFLPILIEKVYYAKGE